MDEDEPAGHLALGIAHGWSRHLDRAEAEARRGLALSPNSVDLLILLANVQIFSGNPAGALQTLDASCAWTRTTRISRCNSSPTPASPSASMQLAIAAIEQRLARNPQSETAYALLASCYGHLGRPEDVDRPGNRRSGSIPAFLSSAAGACSHSGTPRILSVVSKDCARRGCRSDRRTAPRAARMLNPKSQRFGMNTIAKPMLLRRPESARG